MVALMMLAAPGFAAELHLRNGDRVTGELVTRTDGKIHFRSPLLGDLVISELDATVIESVEVPVESLSGTAPVQSQNGRQTQPPAPENTGRSASSPTSPKSGTKSDINRR
jgi:hypothetical protein